MWELDDLFDLSGFYTGGSNVTDDFLSSDVGGSTSSSFTTSPGDYTDDSSGGFDGPSGDDITLTLPSFYSEPGDTTGTGLSGSGAANLPSGYLDDSGSSWLDTAAGWFKALPPSAQSALITAAGGALAGYSNSRSAQKASAAADARAAQQGLISKEVAQMGIDQQNRVRKEDWDRKVASFGVKPGPGLLAPDQDVMKYFDERFGVGNVRIWR